MKNISVLLFLCLPPLYSQTNINGARNFDGAIDAGLSPGFRVPTGFGVPSSANCNSAKAIGSSTNSTPIVVTSASHGFVSGDIVTVYGHTTNTAGNGTWMVGATATNTLALCGYWDGSTCQSPAIGSGVGGATGFISKQVGRVYLRNDAPSAGASLYACTDIAGGSPGWSLVHNGLHGFGAGFSGASVVNGQVAYGVNASACTIKATNILTDATALTLKVWRLATSASGLLPTAAGVINTNGISWATGSPTRSITVSDFTSTAIAANDEFAIVLSGITGTPTFASILVECDQ